VFTSLKSPMATKPKPPNLLNNSTATQNITIK